MDIGNTKLQSKDQGLISASAAGPRITGAAYLPQLCNVFLYLVGLKNFGDFFLITLTIECAHHHKEDYNTGDPARIILRCDCCAENFLHRALLSAENLHMALPSAGSWLYGSSGLIRQNKETLTHESFRKI